MRIPIPVVLLTCLVTALGVWFFNTRNHDFHTEPTPEQLDQTAANWKKNTPAPADFSPKPFQREQTNSQQGDSSLTETSKNFIPTGDLSLDPQLDHYTDYSEKGSAAFIQLASKLETKGAEKYALLAWERVIDSSRPSDSDRTQAANSIKRLKSKVSSGVRAASSRLPIKLHAGATLSDKKNLEAALNQAAHLIQVGSGGHLQVTVKPFYGDEDNSHKLPRIPIAIWLSGENGETAPISFMADPNEPSLLGAQIYASIYAIVRTQLNEKSQLSNLPEYPSKAKPPELLSEHITRLMWQEFAMSLQEANSAN